MTPSCASAPGKVILFGEHAVVYGRPAIAVPVAGVRATAEVRPAPAGSGFRLIAPDLGRDYRLAEAPADDPLAAIVWRTLAHCGQTTPPAAEMTVSSTIPLGRGLGSGAAISPAIARAVAQFLGQPSPPPRSRPCFLRWKNIITARHRALIIRWWLLSSRSGLSRARPFGG